jgi:hypothetical protein
MCVKKGKISLKLKRGRETMLTCAKVSGHLLGKVTCCGKLITAGSEASVVVTWHCISQSGRALASVVVVVMGEGEV